jgi:hypothetical protein
MANRDTELHAGDWVEVRRAGEIGALLDSEGTLDGLPFMPEMIEACGRRFRVLRRAEKACVEFAGGVYRIRDFSIERLVILDGFRCSGVEHDGCQRGCVVFWSGKWLRGVADGKTVGVHEASDANLRGLRAKLKTLMAPGRYFCQSTEMAKITRPLTRARILLKCFRDVWSGSRSLLEMVRLVVSPLWRKRFPRRLVGSQTRTPLDSLGLQPGEVVEFKSPAEITATLDAHGRNRGLLLDYNALCKFKSGQYRVRSRMDRMISEATGEMLQLKNTVILDGISCTCHSVVGGCPRQDAVYWREIWLRRALQDPGPGGRQQS